MVLIAIVAAASVAQAHVVQELHATPAGREFIQRAAKRQLDQAFQRGREIDALIAKDRLRRERRNKLSKRLLELADLPPSEATRREAVEMMKELRELANELKVAEAAWRKLGGRTSSRNK